MARVLIAGNKLATSIAAFSKSYSSLIEDAHIIAVSTLHYTSKSGRVDMLNTFYNVLSEPHKGAFRQYMGRVMGMDREEHWLTFKTGVGFEFVLDRAKQRAEFEADIQNWIEAKEGTAYEPFTKRIALSKAAEPFTDSNVFEQITRLAKRITKDDAKVSPEVKALVNSMLAQAQDTAIKLDRLAKDKANVNAVIAKNAKAGKLIKAEPVIAH